MKLSGRIVSGSSISGGEVVVFSRCFGDMDSSETVLVKLDETFIGATPDVAIENESKLFTMPSFASSPIEQTGLGGGNVSKIVFD